MEDTTQKRTGRFNKDLAKKIEDQIADYEGPADRDWETSSIE